MKRRALSILLTMSIIMTGCSNPSTPADSGDAPSTSESSAESQSDTASASNDEVSDTSESNDSTTSTEDTDNTAADDAQSDTGSEDQASTNDAANTSYQPMNVSFLGDSEDIYYDEAIVPSVPAYSVAEDFSNVYYAEKFASTFEPEYESEYNPVTDLRNALIKNSFAVRNWGHDEFFEIYESNRYSMFPNFVTVDSLMHTYHLYFAYLMKNIEKNQLSDRLMSLSSSMLSGAAKQYEELKGTDWEKAAYTNMVFFYIGSVLQNENTQLPIQDKAFSEQVDTELSRIKSASGVDMCTITELLEDYTQYKPRGYYEGDETLENYFRAMMWYGRIPFGLNNEDSVKSAVLMTLTISDDPEDWESIYRITSFFAGTSDDPGYDVLSEIINSSYGKKPEISELPTSTSEFEAVLTAVKAIEPPKINSIPVEDGDDPVIASYRFMGQRFTIDAAIMQRLVYSSVDENASGAKRMLPDTLDAAAALGSDTAYSILKEEGSTDYPKYDDNLTTLKSIFGGDNPAFWNASLYSGWLNTLRPLFDKKGEGYPSYMQSEEWAKKDLETFAGSFAELKHDTILYSKQVMAEMGGGEEDETPDDRGYVDPEPVVYSRFIFLSNKTRQGLEKFGMLDDSSRDDLELLSEIAQKLLEISEKELKNESLSDDDYEFIRCYGGNLEHFWSEVNKDDVPDLVYGYQAPCPVVADIATDPNGAVLEVGSGFADIIYVVFPIDGELHVGSGSVYSFYQFTVGMDERMTDTEWRNRLTGGYLDDDWNWVEAEPAPDKPAWTMSYRFGEK